MLAPLIVIVVGAIAVAISGRSLERRELAWVFLAYAMHVGSSYVQVWLHYSYYEFSDMHSYIDNGQLIARLLDADASRFGPEVMKLFLHVDCVFPFYVRGEGSPTGSMSAVAGAITFVTGPSVLAVCLVVALLAMLGQLATYKVVREDHPEEERLPLALSLLLVPSVVLWSSALAKEAVAVAFFGLLCAAAHKIAHRKGVIANVVWVVVGGVGVGMVKPYILFPLVLAAAVWFYVSRRDPRMPGIRPAYLVIAAALAAVGIAAMGAAFPEFGTAKLTETTAMQQAAGAQAGGGSYIEIGNAEATTFQGQLPYVPLALANALFRPFIFETRNAPMLGASMETTVLTIMVVALVWRFRWRRVKDAVLGSPTLSFALVFVLTFGVAVGLATTNLGTLSRYRMPMMPFYAVIVLLLRQRLTGSVRSSQGVEV